MGLLSERFGLVKALAPAADRFTTDPATDIINLGLGDAVTFLVVHEGGTTGTATITVEACSDASGTGAEAVAFKYRTDTDGASDVRGDITAATASGVATTAGEEHIVECYVKASELPADKPFVRVQLTETIDDPVNAAVIALVHNPRYQGTDQTTVLS